MGPPAEPYVRKKTPIEELIDTNPEFIMGPPKVPNKVYNAPRDSFVHKMTPRIDLYARKLREVYVRQGIIADGKQYLDPLRMRQESDGLEKCMMANEVPGVISARDEFDDLDMVWPVRISSRVRNADHPWVQPWYVRHPETEEEIRVTCVKIDKHPKKERPYWAEFQRYIVGRPNLLQIPINPVMEEKSLHFIAGADF